MGTGRPAVRCTNTCKLMTQAVGALLALAVFTQHEDYVTEHYGSDAARAKMHRRQAADRAAAREAAKPAEVLHQASRYLIVAEPDHGRYSHSRASLQEAMGLALASGRTLVAPSFTRGCSSNLDRLFHVGELDDGITMVDDALFPDLAGLCGGEGATNVYVWAASSPLYPPAPEGAGAGGGNGGDGGDGDAGAGDAKDGARKSGGKRSRGGGKRGRGKRGRGSRALAAGGAAKPSSSKASPSPASAPVTMIGSLAPPQPDKGAPPGVLTWRGVTWALAPLEDFDAPDAVADAVNASRGGGALASAAGWMEAAPWPAVFPAAYRARAAVFAHDPELGLRLATNPALAAARCVVVHALYHSVNWGALPLPAALRTGGASSLAESATSGDVFTRVAAALEPAPGIEAAVRHWFAQAGLPQHAPLGLHLRLRAPGPSGGASAFGDACAADPAGVVRVLAKLQDWLQNGDIAGDGGGGDEDAEAEAAEAAAAAAAAAAGDGGGNATAPAVSPRLALLLEGLRDVELLVSSDDAGHACTAGVLAAYPGPSRLVDGGRVLSSGEECAGSGFAQEVLGRTAGFVGVGSSMFSTTIHWIRTARFGHAAASTVFL